jgi:hypothetical protein
MDRMTQDQTAACAPELGGRAISAPNLVGKKRSTFNAQRPMEESGTTICSRSLGERGTSNIERRMPNAERRIPKMKISSSVGRANALAA